MTSKAARYVYMGLTNTLSVTLQHMGHKASYAAESLNVLYYITALVKDCSISSVSAIEILQYCTEPSISEM